MPINLSERDHKHAALIEDARMQVTNDWEEEFVADIIAKTKRDPSCELTEKQIEKLNQIAWGEQDEKDLFPRFGRR